MTKTEQRITEIHEELAHVAIEEQTGYIILANTPNGILHAECCSIEIKKDIIRSLLNVDKATIIEIITEFKERTGGHAKKSNWN